MFHAPLSIVLCILLYCCVIRSHSNSTCRLSWWHGAVKVFPSLDWMWANRGRHSSRSMLPGTGCPNVYLVTWKILTKSVCFRKGPTYLTIIHWFEFDKLSFLTLHRLPLGLCPVQCLLRQVTLFWHHILEELRKRYSFYYDCHWHYIKK